MFKTQNFCHIASNNRNNVKVGVFVYRTTDNLATVTTSGYFNDRIIDINLHDLIIHEQVDNADQTKVQRNLLCVTQRTLENVGTTVVKSKWEGDIEQAIADLQTYVDSTFVKKDGTSIMSAPLKFLAGSMRGAVGPYLNGVSFWKMDSQGNITNIANLTDSQFLPVTTNAIDIGRTANIWKDAYVARVITSVINNGFDIAVPVTNSADTLALKSEVDLAANSGRMLTDQGLWYAKMYAATVAPSAENGTNYADFSQVDTGGNPIIVTYERQNGAWVQSETITPPADYDGYVPITSKIWDIAEQAGQQGGRILWNHQSKEFTPYPQIISFEDIEVTGNSTVVMPQNPSTNQIVSKDYVDTLVTNSGTGRNVGDIFLTMRTDNGLNGAVECDGSTYNTTDFSGAQSIGELLEANKIPFVSLSVYATTIANQGWCDKFGWDGTGTTTFKVPTLNAYIWQELQVGVAGTGILKFEQGNGGYLNSHDESLGSTTGWVRTVNSGGSFASLGNLGVSTNASQSGLAVDATNNVSDQRIMVQLVISATDAAVATCTQVLSDVAALNTHKVIAFQTPTINNNYTWYRKYADGWVEQGGLCTDASGDGTVTLPVTMADTNYTVVAMNEATTAENAWGWVYVAKDTKATTGFGLNSRYGTGANIQLRASWMVCGMAA